MKPSRVSARLRYVAAGIDNCSTLVRRDLVRRDLRRVVSMMRAAIDSDEYMKDVQEIVDAGAEVRVFKAVNPGEWPRSGTIVPGFVFPPNLTEEEFGTGRTTRDVMGLQSAIYEVSVPFSLVEKIDLDDLEGQYDSAYDQQAPIGVTDGEWILNEPCKVRLVGIWNLVDGNGIPENAILVERTDDVGDGIGGNLILDAGRDLASQMESLLVMEGDVPKDMMVEGDVITYFSSNLDREVSLKMKEF